MTHTWQNNGRQDANNELARSILTEKFSLREVVRLANWRFENIFSYRNNENICGQLRTRNAVVSDRRVTVTVALEWECVGSIGTKRAGKHALSHEWPNNRDLHHKWHNNSGRGLSSLQWPVGRSVGRFVWLTHWLAGANKQQLACQ